MVLSSSFNRLINFCSYDLKSASKSSSVFDFSLLLSLFLFLAYLMSSLSSLLYMGFKALLSMNFSSRFFKIYSTFFLASSFTVFYFSGFTGSSPYSYAIFLLILCFLPLLILLDFKSESTAISSMSLIVYFLCFW